MTAIHRDRRYLRFKLLIMHGVGGRIRQSRTRRVVSGCTPVADSGPAAVSSLVAMVA